MATSITYKGSELASFSNNTKTLKTAGKYLEGDIIVANTITTQTKATTVIPSESAQTVTLTPDSGKDGLSSASVTVNGITSTYVGSGVGRQGSTVVIPSETNQFVNVVGKYMTGGVTVFGITPTYVGSGVTTNSSLTVEGPTVTAAAGYYADAVTATIPNGQNVGTINYTSFRYPTITVDSSGLVTATLAQAQGTGYRVIGTSGYFDSTNSTQAFVTIKSAKAVTTTQLPTQASTTITPTASTQTITGQKYMTGDITVEPIPSEYVVPTGITTITTNGTHSVSGYASADVSVSPTLQAKTFIPSETSTTITADAGNDGLSSVTVAGITNTYVGSGITRRSSSDVTITYLTSGDWIRTQIPDGLYSDLSINKHPESILPTQSTTTIVPSETAQTAVDIHKWTTGTVTVAAITPTYVGSGVTTNPTITVSGPSVTIPAGYYSSQQTKTVSSGSVAIALEQEIEVTPTISVNSSGVVTSNVSDNGVVAIDVISPGYVSSANTGEVSVTGTSTYQLSTQGATTITPSNATQTIASGKYLTGTITVNPIPSGYTIPSGTYTISSVDSTNTFNVTNYANAQVTITDADNIAY